jgi:ribosomal protein S18 acetylase RimI-like enzyme
MCACVYACTISAVYVCCMAVDPKRRRQAVATRLLTAAEQVARDWGYDSVCLHVHLTNESARACYESVGYRTLHIEPASWLQWLGRPRRALMQKTL